MEQPTDTVSSTQLPTSSTVYTPDPAPIYSSTVYTSTPDPAPIYSSTVYTSTPAPIYSSTVYTSTPAPIYSSTVFIPDTEEDKDNKIKPFMPSKYNSKKSKPLSAGWIAVIVICAVGVAALTVYALKSWIYKRMLLKQTNISIPTDSAQMNLKNPTLSTPLPSSFVRRSMVTSLRDKYPSSLHVGNKSPLVRKRVSPSRKGLSPGSRKK